MSARVGTATCLAIGALMFGAATSALAAAQWVAPVTVSDLGEQNAGAQVAFDAQGEVLLVWARAHCSDPSGPPVTCTGSRIQAAVRPPGQPFGAVQTLTGDPGSPRGDLPGLQLGADAQGGAVALWPSSDTTEQRVRYALRAPGGAFGSVQTISGDDPGTFAINPQVAVDPAGNMVALWISYSGGPTGTAHYALGTTSTGFGPSQPLPGDASADPFLPRPAVAFDGQGNIIAAWIRRESNQGRVRVAIGNLQSFGEPQTITEDSNAFDTHLDLATDGQGDAAMVFTRQVGVSAADVAFALRSPGQPFGESNTIGGNAGNSSDPQVAFAPGGKAMAVWDNQDNDGHHIRVAAREPGQSFGSATNIPPDPGDTPGGSQIALDGQGNALAVWTSFDPSSFKVRWASAPAGQGFGSPGTLQGPDQGAGDPQVAFDPQGNAVATWQGIAPSHSSNIETPILAAGYDAAGPLLGGLSLPSAGTTSRPVPFSVSPVDVWSPISSTRFSFGDGKALSAQAVQAPHTYRSAGRFQVSVTSTDALGNSSSAAGSVKILDRTKPRISRLRMTRRTFAVGARPTARSAAPRGAPKNGSAFRYRLSERARVTIQIARRVAGRRVGHRCRAPSPRLIHRKSCARYVTVGSLKRHPRPAGRKTTAFSGRIGKRALRPGRYRATFRATDPAGNRSAPRRITFRIVPG